MKLLDDIKAGFRFFSELRAVSDSDTMNKDLDNISADLLKAILESESITREQALQIPAVNATIKRISNIVSSLPIKLYKKNGNEILEIKDDKRLYLLNKNTGDTLTSVQFWKAMIEDYYLGIGGYAYINKNFSDYESIHYIENEYIGFMKNTDPIFKNYTIMVNGKEHYNYEFLKILRNSKNGWKGKPIQEESLAEFQIAYATMLFEKNLLLKGGNKKGFLTSEKPLTEDSITRIKEAYRNLYSNNTDNVVVLNAGMKFEESSNSCVEMQLNENKELNGCDICSIFGMKSSVVYGKANKEDIEDSISSCIVPLINDIEASLDRDMLTEQEKEEGYFYAFDIRDLKRGNIKDRYEAYEIAYRNSFLQIDEIRTMEDMEPLGIDFIRLGLDSVLFNPTTKEIYTPNTNEVVNFDNLKNSKKPEGNHQDITA